MRMRSYAQPFLLMLILGGGMIQPAFSQTANAVWTGQAQCQLSVQVPNYSYYETQIWTITGTPNANSIAVYPATWSVTGQGASQSSSTSVQTSAEFATNVPPTNGPLTIFINSANQLIIKSYHSQMRLDAAVTGAQQTFVKGAETDTAITGTEFEWQFPQIEVDPTLTDVSGNSPTPFTARIAPLQPPNTGGTANCSWHFSKGTPASSQTNPSAPAVATSSMNATAIAATNSALIKPTSSVLAQSSSNSIAANASPNVQTTTPQNSTMNCSHWNSIPAIPTSSTSQAASHAYSTDCVGSFSGPQYTPVASLALPPGHYLLIATVAGENFSTSTLANQHYTCSIGFTWGQSKTLTTSGEANGSQQTTLMTLTINGPATSGEVDCGAYQGVSASARTSMVAIEVGAMN